jgi:hypothetical protein
MPLLLIISSISFSIEKRRKKIRYHFVIEKRITARANQHKFKSLKNFINVRKIKLTIDLHLFGEEDWIVDIGLLELGPGHVNLRIGGSRL